jgi:ABC-2 type transport system permease protein
MDGLQGLRKLTLVEFKLFLREHIAVFFGLVFPPMLLVILGSIPAFREPSKDLGGLRVIDLYVPIVIALGLAFMALSTLPTALATYRERGILRRLATTPVGPTRMLLAQLIMNAALAVVVTGVLLGIGTIAFGTDAPHNVIGFLAAFVLAAASLLAIGLLIAAAAPSGRAATGIGVLLFYPLNFFAGLWVPREAMPEVLRRISDYTPLGAGVQSLRDTLAGAWPQPLHLAVMAAFALAAGLAAARSFRWQ